MNTQSLYKIASATLTGVISIAFVSSCAPQQRQYGQQPQGQGQYQGNNPYAVPGLGQQQAPPANGSAPYQPLPGVADAPNVQVPEPSYTPAPNTPTAPSGNASAGTHDVIKGESLWRISRKYGVSVEDIQRANGLNNSDIWAGQKLIIPSGN